MKRKQMMALTLAVMMGTLTACSSGEKEPETAPAKTDSSGVSEEAGKTGAQAGEDGWAPIGSPDAPVDVRIMIKDVFPDEEDVISLTTAINEKMAAHGQYVNVIIEEPPADSYKTAVPLAVMNGEIEADLIYFQGGDEAVSAQGLLEDWTPYLESSQFLTTIMDESNVEKMENYPYLLWLTPPRTPASLPSLPA